MTADLYMAAGALLMGIGAVAIALTFKARKGDQ